MWAVMWDTSELHWQEASYNAQDVWYKVQQQAVHMYGSIHMYQLQQPETLLRPMQGLVCNMTMEMWASRVSWVSQKKFPCSWSKCHQHPKLTTWLVGMLEMLCMWRWNRNRFYSNITLTTLVTQHWHQHHSELGSTLGNVICISYAA